MNASQTRTFPYESLSMRVMRWLGAERVAWSLRRLHCPVLPIDLVLEVGSGANPYWRSNVLVDAYEVTSERHWTPLVTDRPTALAFAENLPFRDKAFDFVIASHVLEHSADPDRFIAELQRVAHAGYIEVPDAFMERVNPYPDHRLELTLRNGLLRIHRKGRPVVDPELVELYEPRAKRWVAGDLIPRHPFDFHVRLYWSGEIRYVVTGDRVHEPEPTDFSTAPVLSGGARGKIQAALLKLLRRLLSQHRRNSAIDLLSLLRCPSCHGVSLQSASSCMQCSCGARYAIRHGVPDLTRPLAT